MASIPRDRRDASGHGFDGGASTGTAPPRSIETARLALPFAIAAVLGAGLPARATAQSFPSAIELSLLDGQNGFALHGGMGANGNGRSVSAAGDLNGDGIGDLIVGAFRASPNGSASGRSFVVFGTSAGFTNPFDLSLLDGQNGFALNGEAAGDGSGWSVSDAGDVNGDGIDDLIIGAPRLSTGDAYAGRSYVVFGSDSGFADPFELSALNGQNGFVLNGEAAGDQAGFSVGGAGDINGDGIGDLVIGAPGADPNGDRSGRSYVVFGSDAGFTSEVDLSLLNGQSGFVLNGEASFDYSGTAVSAAGDINGDGIDDFVVGAPAASPNGSQSGRTYLVFGSASPFPSPLELSDLAVPNNLGFVLDGESGGDRAGTSVSGAGDVDGDGIGELLIGAPGAGDSPNNPGRTYVLFGSSSGVTNPTELSALDGGNGLVLNGETNGDNFGHSVRAAGDINGDGIDDLVVGAPVFGPDSSQSGRSYVVFGSDAGFASPFDASSLDGQNGFALDGEAALDRSGWSVAATGDLNGDGVDDVVVGTPYAGDEGRSYVVFGGNDGPGTGVVAVIADPATAAFGGVPLSGAPLTIPIDLVNGSDQPVQLDSLTLDAPAKFTIADDQCSGQPLGTIVGVNDRCGVEVEFLPDEPGLFEGRLVVTYNSIRSPLDVPLSGLADGVFIDGFEGQ